jgi:hypothetical protein
MPASRQGGEMAVHPFFKSFIVLVEKILFLMANFPQRKVVR